MSDHPLMETYKRLPVAFERGEGPYLYDTDGRQYLDALCGLAVCGLGHAHPRVADAIAKQARTLVHTSNLYEIPLQQELAARLARMSGMERAFFGNSGAEANEAAIKLARLYGHGQGKDAPSIIVMENSFHWRTLATLTATCNRKVQAGFEPLVQGFARAPYDDVEAIEKIAQNNPSVVAIMVEPVLGEGGIQIPADDYLPRLRAIADAQNWLLMLDEVQTGNGRTGRFFAYQHTDILPDVVTTAKGLANGMPIGVCLARGAAADVLVAGTHGSTFGGNPLACAAAMAVLDTLEEERLIERAAQLGERIVERFRTRLNGANHIDDIRGKGLMIAVELSHPCAELVSAAMERGILLNVTADKVVRLLPPLIMSDEQADDLVDRLSELILESAS
ncbi:MAG: aspartate aminotransferase family protein [Gammaproteobacteria bacterium]